MIRYLPELLKENVISQEIADSITNYYLNKKKQGLSKLFLIFGVLGALLVGLGVILIIAHNWDDLPKTVKTVLAFSPLIVSQFLCGFTLLKQKDIAWKESSAIFLFLSIGACISLISQIYHVSGDLSDFLLLWMILSFPVIYIMNSSFTSLLYIAGITYFSCESGYWSHANANHYYYWLLIIGIVPYFIRLVRNTPLSNFVKFHKIFIAFSLIISLGTLAKSNEDLFYFAYLNLFAILSMISMLQPFLNSKEENNNDEIFKILGFTGTMIILFMLSFDWFWKKYYFQSSKLLEIQSFIPLCITTLIVVLLLYRKYRSSGVIRINPTDFVSLLMLLIYMVAGSSLAIILTNSMILFLGVHTIVRGLKSNNLGILNLGMIIMAALIVSRFFDSDITFLARGILFVFVGLCFFFSNYWMLKRRRYEN